MAARRKQTGSDPVHILIVEDDVSLAEWIADYLTDNDYLVSVASNGTDAARQIAEDRPDLVILDINLPKQDGFSVCQQVRTFFDRPILMLTARNEEQDEVRGLQSGANDYLIKPIRPRALLARLRALLRNDPAANLSVRHYGKLTIDADNRSVLLNQQTVHLSSTEFDLLWLLSSNAGKPLAREQIISQLRGIEYDGFDRSVDIMISRIRKKLLDDPAQPFRIKTVRGKGYLFAADSW